MREYDLIIIGAGPAGYVAAIRAGQLNLKTAIVEKEKLGGMCLNWGCIPSKTLMESAKLFNRVLNSKEYGIDGTDDCNITFNWKKAITRKNRIVARLVKGVEYLVKKNRVEIIPGEAKIIDNGLISVDNLEYHTKNILIATGSRPETDSLQHLDASRILQIDRFYKNKEIGDKFVVFGSSAYACETAFMLRYLNKKVTMVTPEKQLMSFLDSELIKFVTDKFNKLGIALLMERSITKAGVDGVFVGEDFIEADTIINCSDRTAIMPQTADLDIALENGFIAVDEYMQTAVPGVYAAGDITGQITAHAGSAQGLTAVNHMAGIKEPLDYDKIPVNIYLSPEIASVGMTEEQVKQSGREYGVGKFTLMANGKAMAEGATEGFVKVIAEKKYGEVLGVHIVAPHATDMISEAVTIMQLEGTLEDVGRVVHAHPTVSEAMIEASLVALGQPRHI